MRFADSAFAARRMCDGHLATWICLLIDGFTPEMSVAERIALIEKKEPA